MPGLNNVFFFELGAFLFCAIAFFARKKQDLFILFMILLITVTAESLGGYFRLVLHRPNMWIYNISVPLVILGFFRLFYPPLKSITYKRLVMAFMALFILFAAINMAAGQLFFHFNTFTYITGALLLSITVCLYLKELISAPAHISLFRQFFFWISAAILLLYVPKAFLYISFEYLVYQEKTIPNFGIIFKHANNILGAVFYTLIGYACFCRLAYRE